MELINSNSGVIPTYPSSTSSFYFWIYPVVGDCHHIPRGFATHGGGKLRWEEVEAGEERPEEVTGYP
jgi:hypothetical protein